MSRIIEHFKTIAKIPHCSGQAHALRDFLVDFAKQHKYNVELDNADNILIYKGEPHLALQAHYDMVCMGEAPNIEVYEENGWLKAKNSSLGADNGIAIAMMMVLIEDGYNLEFLLTSDEEIGLIGANNVEFELQSKYMLNIDSESEAEVYIGCAGGIDIKATKSLKMISNDLDCYEVSIFDLPGGHSGVDIDKNIPNAIIQLAQFLHEHDISLVSIGGGERINSIPANAKAVISGNNIEFLKSKNVAIKQIEKQSYKFEESIIAHIAAFGHGVLKFNDDLGIPQVSQNLALVSLQEDILTMEVSIRAMSIDELDLQAKATANYFRDAGFAVDKRDKYPAWNPEENEFTEMSAKCIYEVFGKSTYKAIHAGLECGVLKQKYPHMLFASIGPTIVYPHSIREAVDLESVEKTFEVLKTIIQKVG
ncbi:MAG: M20/M25/M40 family metallo-hydrolase [Campylobacterales bacterium]|nr:M20/M25/M40 family metallo-hydrolase [Campylobacterales bacterium]